MYFSRLQKTPKSLNSDGFTLIELIIAVAIFSLISTASYHLLQTVIDVERKTNKIWSNINNLQKARLIMERDLMQIVSRPIKNEHNQTEPAVVAGDKENLVEFTRTGWRIFDNIERSELQRVSYQLKDNNLIRHYWPVLDRSSPTETHSQIILTKVQDFQIVFMDYKNRWYRHWPSKINTKDSSYFSTPTAIEIQITHEHFGQINMTIYGTDDPNNIKNKPVAKT